MGRPLGLVWRVLEAVVRTLVRVLGWRVDVQGLEHVPSAGGAVLAFNHHSYFDFVMVAFPVVARLRRPVRFLAKREVWDHRPLRWLADAVGAIPVDRSSVGSRRGAFAAAVEALGRGDLAAVAPEQTISRSFQLLPFRTGAVRMAQAAGVPVVPVIGWGTQRFATKGHRPRPVRRISVVVRFGEPVRPGPDDDPRQVTRRLQERMAALLDEVQRAYPDRPAPGDDWWQPAALGGSAPPHEDVVREHRGRIGPWEV